jgi:hypothetical protein
VTELENVDLNKSSMTAFEWILLVCAVAALGGLGYLCYATDGNLRGVLLTIDDGSDHVRWNLRGKDGTKAQMTRGKRKGGSGSLLDEDALAYSEQDHAQSRTDSSNGTTTVPPLQLDGVQSAEGSSLYESPPRSWRGERNPVDPRQTQVAANDEGGNTDDLL